MIEIRIINENHKNDINLPNEPFKLWGYLRPSYLNGNWDYTIEKRPPEEITEQCFPEENYNYDEMKQDYFFVGAYDDNRCVGLAIFQKDFYKYLYLDDLKVNKDYRGRGIATALIEKGKELALTNGYRGLYTIGQDNNLSACLFYLHAGFNIGGLNTDIYKGTKQEGKADIWFYLDN